MFGVPDEKWGERVVAVVEPKPGATVVIDELAAFAREKLGSVKAPKEISLMPQLPRSAAGKVLRSELRKPYWENRAPLN